MHVDQPSTIAPSQLASILLSHPKRWLIPAVVLAVVAGLYAVIHAPTWQASQALIVRNEVTAGPESPGKFNHSEEMKTVQETILELVKSRGVLGAALSQVGPPENYRKAPSLWPTARDVAKLRDRVALSPPKGAEFGMTEVFYLKVKDRDRDRAVDLVAAICRQLESRFQELRDTKAQSMIDEVGKAVKLAGEDLAESTGRLTEIETQVGDDLAELRILHVSNSGESALRRTVTEIRNELRQTQAVQKSNEELLVLLKGARQDSSSLVATPNRLLESQPALRRLKEGLVDAQLRTADLQGRMSDIHPLVRAAKQSEEKIARRLYEELVTAVRGVEVELRLDADRVAMLREQLAAVTERLARLAALRAHYSTQLAETENRTELLKRAEQKLAEARVSQASAKAASLIGRIDAPEAGTKPVGPGRSVIVLTGIAGGLIAGLGIVFLTVPPAPSVSSDGRPGGNPTTLESPRSANGKPRNDTFSGNGGLSLKEALEKIADKRQSWS